MDALAPTILAGGCGLAVGIIIGLILGWQARRNVARDLAQDVATFRAEMALAEKRTELDLRTCADLAPEAVRQ